MVVTISDVRRLGYCTRGIRRWAEAAHLDFADFLQNGIDEETLLASGDGLAAKIVERLKELPHG